MVRATERELIRLYRKPEAPAGHTVAMDASFTSMAARLLKELGKRFTGLFTEKAGGLAGYLAKGIQVSSAAQLGDSLKQVSGGVTLKTDVVSGKVADVTKAAIKQNVALIKSIPTKYFERIEGEVMRSIQTGRGMADLQPAIENIGAVTKKRAGLIARDQTSKATTAINKARMLGLGVRKFEWVHTMGEKFPRELHRDVLNGNIYEFDNPPVIDERTGERGLPGQLINCFTGSTEVSLTNGCSHVWRYWHSGQIVRIGIMGNTIFEGTLNHPVLTGRGWLPAHEVQEGDYLASSLADDQSVIDGHDAENAVTFRDLYVALVGAGETVSSVGSEFNFHGDIPEHDVDSVAVEQNLSLRLKTGGRHEVEKLLLANTDRRVLDTSAGFVPEVFHPLGASIAGQSDALLRCEQGHADKRSLVAVSGHDPVLLENVVDDLPGAIINARDFENTDVPRVELQDGGRLSAGGSGGFLRREDVARLIAADGVGQVVGATLMGLAEVLERHPFVKGFHCVQNKDMIEFSGHVYTMETDEGWYPLAVTQTVSKNCRCRMVPVISFEAVETSP